MGAGKFPEEILERYVESVPLRVPKAGGRVRQPTTKPKPKYCPLCAEAFLEESTLALHVANRHGKQHVYLKVNGQIVRDVCWLRQPLAECKLVLLGIPSLNIEITANGKTCRLKIKKTAELVGHMKPLPRTGIILVKVLEPRFRTSCTLYIGSQPEFQAEKIDRQIAETIADMQVGKRVDLLRIRDRVHELGLNELEERYLDGLLEYCHGWKLREAKSMQAKQRLEASFGRLMPFDTSLAREARCALALIMNCFSGRWGCGDDSPFRLAESFFCRDVQNPELGQRREPQILLDATSRMVLGALDAYFAEDDRGVFKILDGLPPAWDKNDEDKFYLIEARTNARMLNKRAAVQTYEMLIDHPVFGTEAKGYCASQRGRE